MTYNTSLFASVVSNATSSLQVTGGSPISDLCAPNQSGPLHAPFLKQGLPRMVLRKHGGESDCKLAKHVHSKHLSLLFPSGHVAQIKCGCNVSKA